MARIPDSTAVSGAPALRPSGAIAVADMSPIARGAQNLAAGISDAAGSLYAYAKKEEAKENVADVAAADAAMRKRNMEIQAEFENDNDYMTFDKRGNALTTAAKDEAAKLIRNEETRQAWLGQAELQRLTQVEAINSRGRQLKSGLDVAKFDDANKTIFEEIANPYSDPADAVRNTNTIIENLKRAEETGLITPAMRVDRMRVLVAGAQQARAENLAYLLARQDPAKAKAMLGVAGSPGDVSSAMAVASNGQPIALSAEVATIIAKQIGDESFPADPEDIEAFLTDAEKNQEYVAEAFKLMQAKLDGDVSAAVIALAPGGSIELARKYQETGDENDLPPAVADFLFTTMSSVSPAGGGVDLPIEWDSEIGMESLPELDRWEKAQSMFGQTVRIVSRVTNAENDAAGGRAGLNLDVSDLSEKERTRLMEVASAAGFAKIGIYKDAMHLEVGDGEPEVWGAKGGDVPAWAADLASKHMAGVITETTVTTGLHPDLAAASYEVRVAASRDADEVLNQQKLESRGWIATAVENLPSAIANGIPYEGKIPTPKDFVNAYGAEQGIPLWNAFEAQRDLATTIVGYGATPSPQLLEEAASLAEDIKNAPYDQIASVEKASAAKAEAIKTVLAARDADPAAATLQAFPQVKAAWDAATEDPSQMPAAVKAMYEAQTMLGIDPSKMRVLPAAVAKGAVDSFKNINLEGGDEARRQAIFATVALADGDETMQDAIVAQLITDAGAPRQLKAALAPLEREGFSAKVSAEHLLSASMATEDALGLKGTGEQNIKTGIVNRVEVLADDNGLAQVMYGLGYGVDNLERWNDDKDLLTRATALYMQGGRMNEEDAFKLALKDMYGDVKPVTGRNANVIIDAKDDGELMGAGFDRAMVPAKAVLKQVLTEGFQANFPDVSNNKFIQYALGRSLEDVIETGYWANGPEKDTFVFVHGPTGQMLPDPYSEGRPYTLTKDAIERMGRSKVAQEKMAVEEGKRGVVPEAEPQVGPDGYVRQPTPFSVVE